MALGLVTALVLLTMCSLSPSTGGGSLPPTSQSQPLANEAPANSDAQKTHEANQTAAESSSAIARDETTPREPASLPAGTQLSAQDIQQGGGEDAFFWSEEISDETFARMDGKSYKADCTVPLEDLRYLKVLYKNAEAESHVGELVVHREVADEVVDIFRQLYDAGYPIRKMVLVDDYEGASDELSCADDNTSAFNWRLIEGSNTISYHAYGLAIDINTFENPYYVPRTDYIIPPGAWRYVDRSLREPYMIHSDDLCYQLFTEHGWSWGGDWGTPKDYQHFEKPSVLYE